MGGLTLENKKMLSISIIILALSIIFSTIWIGQSLNQLIKTQISITQPIIEKALLTDKEAAEYLNISNVEFNNLLLNDQQEKREMTKAGIHVYSTYKFVPYLELNGKKLFSKDELDQWIKHNMSY